MSNNLRLFVVAGGAVGALLVAGVAFLSVRQADAAELVVYKSPTCGCCSKWVDHLRAAGFDVTTHDVDDVSPIKAQHGITGETASCHTAIVDGYVVEGHVPANAITRLLQERPDLAGLSVPGMPVGSPGMEGTYAVSYDVVAIHRSGATTLYERH